MKSSTKLAVVLSSVLFVSSFGVQAGQDCRQIKAEVSANHVACANSAAVFCLAGEIDGNFGLNGKVTFTGESLVPGPATGPDAQSIVTYSGVWNIVTPNGTLKLREAGVSNVSTGNVTSGLVSAFDAVIGGTGKYQGRTGFVFVQGKFDTEPSTFELRGQLCR